MNAARILGFTDNDLEPYKQKSNDNEYCEINGIKIQTGGMQPGSTIVINGTTITKNMNGGISVSQTGSGCSMISDVTINNLSNLNNLFNWLG
jgi:hypothetical protein